jgi:heme/copper-type cytochrome/quinol oxidase subunit 2
MSPWLWLPVCYVVFILVVLLIIGASELDRENYPLLGTSKWQEMSYYKKLRLLFYILVWPITVPVIWTYAIAHCLWFLWRALTYPLITTYQTRKREQAP